MVTPVSQSPTPVISASSAPVASSVPTSNATATTTTYVSSVVPRARQVDSAHIVTNSSDELTNVRNASSKILDDKFRQRVDAAQAELLRQAEEKKVAEQIKFPYFSGDIESLKGIINDSIVWLNNNNDARGKLIFELAKNNTEENKVKIEEGDSKEIKDAKKAYILLRRTVFVAADGKSEIQSNATGAQALATEIQKRMGQIQLSRKTSNKVILDNLKTVNSGWVLGIGSNDGDKLFKYNNREYSAFGIIKGFLDGESKATQDLTGYMKGKHKTKINIPALSPASVDDTTSTIISMIANNENIFSSEGRSALASANPALSQEIQKVFQGDSIQKEVLKEIQDLRDLGTDANPLDFLTQANKLRDDFRNLGNSSNPDSRSLIKLALKIYFLDYFSNLSGDLGVAFNEKEENSIKTTSIQLTQKSIDAFNAGKNSDNQKPNVGGINTTKRLNGLLQAYNDEAAKQDNIIDKIAEDSGYKRILSEFLDGVVPDIGGPIQLNDWSRQYIDQAKVNLAKSLFADATLKDASSIQEKAQGRSTTNKSSDKDATERALIGTIFDKVVEVKMESLKKRGEAAKSVITQVTSLIPTNLAAA